MNRAFQLCIDGAPLLAIGKNRYFKTEEELQLDSGAFIHGLEWAAGIEALVFGKPGKLFFESAIASTGLLPEECLMIGDDIDGDIIAARESGLQATLVRTGKYRSGDETRLPEGAEVIDTVDDLFR